MTSTDNEVREDLTEAGADALLDAARVASMAPEGLSHFDAENLAQAMAVAENYGNWTPAGFSPYLRRPVEIDAKSFAARTGKPYPVALRTVQKAIVEACADPDSVLARVILNTSHEDDPTAAHIVAIYTEPGQVAYDERNAVVVAFHYTPTTYTGSDGRELPSYFNRTGISGIVAEWSDYDEAEEALDALKSAFSTMRRLSAQKARNDAVEAGEEVPTFRRPRPAAF